MASYPYRNTVHNHRISQDIQKTTSVSNIPSKKQFQYRITGGQNKILQSGVSIPGNQRREVSPSRIVYIGQQVNTPLQIKYNVQKKQFGKKIQTVQGHYFQPIRGHSYSPQPVIHRPPTITTTQTKHIVPAQLKNTKQVVSKTPQIQQNKPVVTKKQQNDCCTTFCCTTFCKWAVAGLVTLLFIGAIITAIVFGTKGVNTKNNIKTQGAAKTQATNPNQNNQNNLNATPQTIIQNCTKGYFQYNGKCLSCVNESTWNGTNCVKKVTTYTNPNTIINNNPNTPAKNNIVQDPNNLCESGFFIYKGQCIQCPKESVWDGSNCVVAADTK